MHASESITITSGNRAFAGIMSYELVISQMKSLK